MYVLARGAVSITIGDARRANRIVTFAPGSIFGEAAMLDGGLRSANAVVAEDAVVYSRRDRRSTRSPRRTRHSPTRCSSTSAAISPAACG